MKTYPKAWLKCISKTQQYKTKSVDEWKYYELLGYVLSNTTQVLEPVDITQIPEGYINTNISNPRNHPLIETVRLIYRQFNKCPQQTKTFLDWCLAKYSNKLKVEALRTLSQRYLAVEQTTNATISLHKRTDTLPNNIKEALSELNVNTYGDLSFMAKLPEYKKIITQKLANIKINISDLNLEKVV